MLSSKTDDVQITVQDSSSDEEEAEPPATTDAITDSNLDTGQSSGRGDSKMFSTSSTMKELSRPLTDEMGIEYGALSASGEPVHDPPRGKGKHTHTREDGTQYEHESEEDIDIDEEGDGDNALDKKAINEGYVLVFKVDTLLYKLNIKTRPSGHQVITAQMKKDVKYFNTPVIGGFLNWVFGDPKPMSKKKWAKRKDNMLYELDTRKVKHDVHYKLKFSPDKRFIFALVTVDVERIIQYMDMHDFDLEIDPVECVKYARRNMPNFQLAQNTYIPELDNDTVILEESPDDPTRKIVKRRVPDRPDLSVELLSIKLWSHIHIPYESTLDSKVYMHHSKKRVEFQERDVYADSTKASDGSGSKSCCANCCSSICSEMYSSTDHTYAVEYKEVEDDTGAIPAVGAAGHQKRESLPVNIITVDSKSGHLGIEKSDVEKGSFLNNRLALRAIFSFLTEDTRLGGCGFKIENLLSDWNHPLISCYAINDLEKAHRELVRSESKKKLLSEKGFDERQDSSNATGIKLPHLNFKDKDSILNVLFDVREVFIEGMSQISKASGRMIVQEIREHYGEQIAFYFAFLMHYQRWLKMLSPVGFIFFFIQVGMDEIAVPGAIYIVLIFLLWGTAMLENWYRLEHKLKLEWGMMRLSQTEVPRPGFQGTLMYSPTSGQLIEDYAGLTMYYLRIFGSFTTITLLVGGVVAIVVQIWTLKESPLFSKNSSMSFLLGVINSVQITFFNVVYTYLAQFLNDKEGHRLESEYYNHLVVKRILFYVVNSFNSIVYLAFFKQYRNNKSRLNSVRLQLVTLFISMIFIQNITEVFLPLMMKKFSDWYSGESDKKQMMNPPVSYYNAFPKGSPSPRAPQATGLDTVDEHQTQGSAVIIDDNGEASSPKAQLLDPGRQASSDAGLFTSRAAASSYDSGINMVVASAIWADAEKQFDLPETPSVLDNTAELVVQFGYVTLFAIVFPLMPFLALVNNLVEFRLDFWTLTHSRRPIPLPATGIGVWKPVLSTFLTLSIPTNMILICFRTKIPKTYGMEDDYDILTFFFILCVIMLFFQFLMRVIVPDYTNATKGAMERQFQCEKYLFLAKIKQTAHDKAKQDQSFSPGGIVRSMKEKLLGHGSKSAQDHLSSPQGLRALKEASPGPAIMVGSGDSNED